LVFDTVGRFDLWWPTGGYFSHHSV